MYRCRIYRYNQAYGSTQAVNVIGGKETKIEFYRCDWLTGYSAMFSRKIALWEPIAVAVAASCFRILESDVQTEDSGFIFFKAFWTVEVPCCCSEGVGGEADGGGVEGVGCIRDSLAQQGTSCSLAPKGLILGSFLGFITGTGLKTIVSVILMWKIVVFAFWVSWIDS